MTDISAKFLMVLDHLILEIEFCMCECEKRDVSMHVSHVQCVRLDRPISLTSNSAVVTMLHTTRTVTMFLIVHALRWVLQISCSL